MENDDDPQNTCHHIRIELIFVSEEGNKLLPAWFTSLEHSSLEFYYFLKQLSQHIIFAFLRGMITYVEIRSF